MADGSQIDTKTAEAIEKQIKGFGDNIKALGDDTQKSLTEMRGLIDGMPKAADIVTKERIDKFAAEVETKTNAIETGLGDIRADLDKVATALNRTDGGWKGEDGAKEAKAAYEFHRTKMAKEGKLAIGAKLEPDAAAIKGWNESFGLYMRRGSETGAHVLTPADRKSVV